MIWGYPYFRKHPYMDCILYYILYKLPHDNPTKSEPLLMFIALAMWDSNESLGRPKYTKPQHPFSAWCKYSKKHQLFLLCTASVSVSVHGNIKVD